MGSDIHAHIEVKINGHWHHLTELDIERDYDLFSLMAGVRHLDWKNPTPIAEPRGIPVDVTFLTKFFCEIDGLDGHSHSWLSAEEVCRVGEWLGARHKAHRKEGDPEDDFRAENILGWIFNDRWTMFTTEPEWRPKGLEDGRLVFWFDN